MVFYREEKPAHRQDANWRKDTSKGAPQGQDTMDNEAEGQHHWPQPNFYMNRQRDNQTPAYPQDAGQVSNNTGPGSRVTPPTHTTDFVNNTDRGFRFATRLMDLENRLSPAIIEKAKGYQPRLVSITPDLQVFRVGNHEVRVALPRGAEIMEVDLKLSCGCPFWQYQGPEHWAQEEGYLYGPLRGTGTPPDIRDPQHRHAICKHVYAVLQSLRKRSRRASHGRVVAVVNSAHRVVGRYLSRRL